MKYIMFVAVLIIGFIIGFTALAKGEALRIADIGWVVGKTGKTVEVYKFVDGKNNCYVSQYTNADGTSVDISCMK